MGSVTKARIVCWASAAASRLRPRLTARRFKRTTCCAGAVRLTTQNHCPQSWLLSSAGHKVTCTATGKPQGLGRRVQGAWASVGTVHSVRAPTRGSVSRLVGGETLGSVWVSLWFLALGCSGPCLVVQRLRTPRRVGVLGIYKPSPQARQSLALGTAGRDRSRLPRPERSQRSQHRIPK